jgi:hypothetical protein
VQRSDYEEIAQKAYQFRDLGANLQNTIGELNAWLPTHGCDFYTAAMGAPAARACAIPDVFPSS